MSATNEATVKEKKHYWLREDFEEMMKFAGDVVPDPSPRPNSSSSLVYPKNTEGAFRELRMRGLQVDGIKLWQMAEDGIVSPNGARPGMTWTGKDRLEWSKEDIDQAAEWLYEHEHWTPWTHFCWVCNLRFGQCAKAHRLASARYRWGFSSGFDVLGKNFYIERADDPDEYAFIHFLPDDFDFETLEDSK